MTKIGSPGGPTKLPMPEFENKQVSPTKEALPEKIMPQAGSPSSATEAKGVMDSQAELMKVKLQENLKTAGAAGTAIPDKWSPPHSSPVPIHQNIDLPGSANTEKWPPTHPSVPIHPDVHLPGTAMPDKWSPGDSSPPHPDVQLPISAPPSKLVNDKPATQLTEEKEKK